MWKKNLRRFIGKLLISLLTIFLVATFNFFLIRFMPGDPLEHLVGEEDYLYLTSAHPEVLEELEVEYGLDGTLWEQYTSYLGRLLHGEMCIRDSPTTKERTPNAAIYSRHIRKCFIKTST